MPTPGEGVRVAGGRRGRAEGGEEERRDKGEKEEWVRKKKIS